MDHSIHPSWVNVESLSHIIRGIALTARYVPTQKPNRPEPGEDFSTWEGNFYKAYSSKAFTPLIHKGVAVVLAKDKAGRRNLYEKLGMPLDKTVE